MTPQEILKQYFETVVWRPEWDAVDFEPAQVESFLQNPEHGLLPFANEAVLRKLTANNSNFGLRASDLHRLARAAVTKVIEFGVRENLLGAYESAIVRLMVESVLVSRAAGTALFPWADERTRRTWIDNIRLSMRPVGADGRGGFSCVKDIPAQRMARLAVSREALGQNASAVKSAIAEAIKGAIEAIRPEEPISIEAQIRLCIIRFWLQSEEGTQSQVPADRVLRAAGLDRQRLDALVDEITNERGVDGLFAREGSDIDLNALVGFQEFGASADFYGFRFDPSSFDRLRRLGAEMSKLCDPWVKQLYRLALSRAPASSQANAELDRLGDDRTRRDRALVFFVTSQILPVVDWSPIVNAELATAERSLGGKLFRSLVRLRFQRERSRFDEVLYAIGLREWFEHYFAMYLRGEFEGDARLEPELLVQLAMQYEAMRRESELAAVADEVRAEAVNAREAIERQQAASRDRAWLFDLVSKGGGLSSSRYDDGRRILSDGDRQLIRRMAELRQANQPRWWDQELQLGSELRLRETWVRVYGGDPGPLKEVAERVARQIQEQLQPQLRETASRHLDMCLPAVTEGRIAPREARLRAVRDVNAVEFMQQLEGVQVDLPPKRRPRRVFGRRVAIGLGIVLLLPLTLLGRVLFASGVGVDKKADPNPQVAPVLPVLEPASLRWTPLDSQGLFLYRVSAEEIQRHFGGLADGSRSTGFATQPRPIAEEFLSRYESSLRDRYSGGIRQSDGPPSPWSTVGFRLPRREDMELISKKTGSGVCWLSDDAPSSAGPFEEKQIYVVIEIRK